MHEATSRVDESLSQSDYKKYFEIELSKYLEKKANIRWVREINTRPLNKEKINVKELVDLGWTDLSSYYKKGEIKLEDFIFFFECWGRNGSPHQVLHHYNLVNLILNYLKDSGENYSFLENFLSQNNYGCAALAFRDENFLSVQMEGNRYLINGQTPMVMDVYFADFLLCFGCNDGNYQLLIFDVNDPLLEKRIHLNVDGSPALNINFSNYLVDSKQVLANGAAAKSLHNTLLGLSLVMESACLIGLSKSLFQMSLDYVNMRNQFSKPLFSNQVVQHKLVDLVAQIRMANASLSRIVRYTNKKDYIDLNFLHDAFFSKYQCSVVAKTIAKEALQLHGAIGYTEECDVSLFVKKIMKLSVATMSPHQCLNVYSEHIR